jgi:hypothetical protein
MPSSISFDICSSKRPVLIRSEMMIGFDVAPVAPSLRLERTRSGSIESSQTFVPEAMSDWRDMGRRSFPVCGKATLYGSFPRRVTCLPCFAGHFSVTS